jgi:hypothetical protein
VSSSLSKKNIVASKNLDVVFKRINIFFKSANFIDNNRKGKTNTRNARSTEVTRTQRLNKNREIYLILRGLIFLSKKD